MTKYYRAREDSRPNINPPNRLGNDIDYTDNLLAHHSLMTFILVFKTTLCIYQQCE